MVIPGNREHYTMTYEAVELLVRVRLRLVLPCDILDFTVVY